jgi:predicted DNA-binding WGR domain protein
MPYFEFIGEDASRKSERAEKYWEVTQVGKNVSVRFGKIGADGQLKVKEFETKEEAEAEVAKLIKEKTKKGYISSTFYNFVRKVVFCSTFFKSIFINNTFPII